MLTRPPLRLRRLRAIALQGAIALLFSFTHAWAAVPGQVSHQGLLLDALGAPVNAQVDLVFTLFDALSGGTQQWTETHLDVDVVDGVYDVELGSTTPLSGAVLSGGNVFLEIEVEGETLSPRQQLLAVPYALEAENASNLSGVSGIVFAEIFEHVSFDGGDPPNDDPSEGTADADNDGLANFVDPDNDDDGLSDVAELAQGSDINLVTPTITGVNPSTGVAADMTNVTVTGSSFEAGQTVTFGSQTPTPTGLTSTSFDVLVGPQTSGFADVTVLLPNGEDVTASSAFEFIGVAITGFVPNSAYAIATTDVTVNGLGFVPGLTVSFGSESPTPTNLTATSFDVTVGPQAIASAVVTVTLPNTEFDTSSFPFTAITSETHGATIGIRPSFGMIGTNQIIVGSFRRYVIDRDDAGLDPEGASNLPSTPNDTVVVFDPLDRVVGLRCRTNPVLSTECFAEVAFDSDGNDVLNDPGVLNQQIEVLTQVSAAPELLGGALAFDSTGGVAAGYTSRRLGATPTTRIVVAHDRDGNGDFLGVNEVVEVDSGGWIPEGLGDLAIDGSDRVAFAYRRQDTGDYYLAYDRSGDGDFDDTVGGNPEVLVVPAIGSAGCLGLTFDSSDHVAMVFGATSGATTFLRDFNGDGDFADSGETGQLPLPNAQGGCDVVGHDTFGLAAVNNAFGDLRLYMDLNNDNDFADPGEDLVIDTSNPGPLEVDRDSNGRPIVVGPTSIWVGPEP